MGERNVKITRQLKVQSSFCKNGHETSYIVSQPQVIHLKHAEKRYWKVNTENRDPVECRQFLALLHASP